MNEEEKMFNLSYSDNKVAYISMSDRQLRDFQSFVEHLYMSYEMTTEDRRMYGEGLEVLRRVIGR